MSNKQYFYHATQELYCHSLMQQGFKLDKELNGRGWGNGVYLSSTIDFAREWGKIIVRCELNKGTRILWHSDPDPKVLKYLKREFGAKITSPSFWKDLPRNKQFTKKEIIAVWNHLINTCYESEKRFNKGLYEQLEKNYSRIYEQLKLHQFDGVGLTDPDWPEVLIFNPAKVKNVSAHSWDSKREKLSGLLSSDELKHLQKGAEQELKEL